MSRLLAVVNFALNKTNDISHKRGSMDGQPKESLSKLQCKNCASSIDSSGMYVTQCRVDSSSKLTATDNDELREEMIKALAWACCRAFKYKPSDPIHYLAHQLLRWRYGDISEYSPRMVNFNKKYGSGGHKISSPSFCSDGCEYTCIGKSSENEMSM